jgi:hypothetical protein
LEVIRHITYSEQQLQVLQDIGYPDFDFENADDDSYFDALDKLEDALIIKGINRDDSINEYGLVCESILDFIGEYT